MRTATAIFRPMKLKASRQIIWGRKYQCWRWIQNLVLPSALPHVLTRPLCRKASRLRPTHSSSEMIKQESTLMSHTTALTRCCWSPRALRSFSSFWREDAVAEKPSGPRKVSAPRCLCAACRRYASSSISIRDRGTTALVERLGCLFRSIVAQLGCASWNGGPQWRQSIVNRRMPE